MNVELATAPGPHPVRHSLFPRAHFAEFLMLFSALAFASMSACANGLQGRCDWRIAAVARAGLAFAITWAVARQFRSELVWPGPRTLWMRSITGSLGMLFTFFVLGHLPIAGSVTLMNSFPLWVALLSWPVLGVRPSLTVWVALACGLCGVGLIAHSYSGGPSGAEVRWLAIPLAIAASLSTAIVMFGLHRLRHLDPLAIVVHFSGIASIVCLGYAIVTGLAGRPIAWTGIAAPVSIALLAGVGLFASLGQILMTTAFQHGPPDRLATIGLMQVVFALGYDFLFWGHELDGSLSIGIALVLVPAAWLIAHRRFSARK